jgi:type III pantothenate kinase
MVTLQLFMGTFSAQIWLALVAGNSRLHWGLFAGDRFLQRWDTPHYSAKQFQGLKDGHFTRTVWPTEAHSAIPSSLDNRSQPLPLWMAAVVHSPLEQLQDYPGSHVIQLPDIPLKQGYTTLGIDRALALLGAGITYGWPALVIDGGTAMTFTAGTIEGFWGGAILPGLGLQFRSLHQGTAQLPEVDFYQSSLPRRWASTTPEAMSSGILYTQLAGIQSFARDWRRQFPDGYGLLTGGDGPLLTKYLALVDPELANWLQLDLNLAFWGLKACRRAQANL